MTQATEPGFTRVAIDPVSRVEGHGKVTILLDAERRVQQVRLHIVEFRGFERFVQGRPYWEVPVMVQRLCGICPVSHHLAASKALDAVAGAARVPPAAEKLRRLMHYGQVLQSHALHFFYLASPDLLFGFDSEPERRNIAAVIEAEPELARQGVLLRKLGQEVIRATAGKRIHGTGSVPGGMNKPLSAEDRTLLRALLPDALEWAQRVVALTERLEAEHGARWERFGTVPAGFLSLVRPDGAMELYDGVLRAIDAQGATVFDGVDPASYRARIEEEVRSWSYMKFPYLTELGPERGRYRVGPLARLQTCAFIDTPRAEEARQRFRADHGPGLTHAPLHTHRARMIELLHSVEVLARLLDDDALLEGPVLDRSGPRARGGVGVIEAPRGTLIHQYEVGDDDLVTACNLIVSTTHNNHAMNEAVTQVAREYLDGREPTEALLNHVEVAIRAYDPCLSCATHALGKMPLRVRVLDAAGALVRELRRDGEAL